MRFTTREINNVKLVSSSIVWNRLKVNLKENGNICNLAPIVLLVIVLAGTLSCNSPHKQFCKHFVVIVGHAALCVKMIENNISQTEWWLQLKSCSNKQQNVLSILPAVFKNEKKFENKYWFILAFYDCNLKMYKLTYKSWLLKYSKVLFSWKSCPGKDTIWQNRNELNAKSTFQDHPLHSKNHPVTFCLLTSTYMLWISWLYSCPSMQ